MLLSYPDDSDANSVKLLDNSGNVMFEAKTSDTLFSPDEVKPFPAFNAYSIAGDYEVTAQELFPSKQIVSIALNTYFYLRKKKQQKTKKNTKRTQNNGQGIRNIPTYL